MRFALSAMALVASASLAASGTIVAVSTTTKHIAPPASAGSGLGAQFATAWNERQNVAISAVQAEITSNPGNSWFTSPGLVTGMVDSHMLTHNGSWIDNSTLKGWVTFDNPIVAVIFDARSLNATDFTLGSPTTNYHQNLLRGFLNTLSPNFLQVNGNTLTYDFARWHGGFYDYSQVRVLTAVPAPGAAACLALAILAPRRRR